MKKFLSSITVLMFSVMIMNAENIKLPAPKKAGGLPVNQTLSERRSIREYDTERALPLQTISDLLWATCGINRPDENKRTNPTGRDLQEIDAYWIDANGTYYYNFKTHELEKVATGDHRNLVAGTRNFSQDFVLDAPGSVVLVVDTSKLPEGDRGLMMGYIDAGIACENINIFCAANGLATVPRMTMDIEGLQTLLALPKDKIPVLNNPVGYAK